jgi:3-dehydroquinate synthase
MMNRHENPLQQIEIGSLLDSSLEKILTNSFQNAKIAILVDDNTHEYCLEYLITNYSQLANAEVIQIPSGEENKDLEISIQLWEALTEFKFGKTDLLINLGGGMITDLGGFVASIYKRGIPFINIPTSLLAMVDASIGGKNGVDFCGIKNQLGSIQFPELTIIDDCFLQTLPDDEIKNGFAEIIKHALISDLNLWNDIKIGIGEMNPNRDIINKAIRIKMDIVSKDPFESGIRKLLNFGHTIGHGLEGALLDINPISHGHAVAIGMIGEAYISMKLGFLEQRSFDEIKGLILSIYSHVEFSEQLTNELLVLIRQDKKNQANKINCTLLKEIGEACYDNYIDENLLRETLNYLQNL